MCSLVTLAPPSPSGAPNPRSRFKRDTRLAGEPLRPLGHLSGSLDYVQSVDHSACLICYMAYHAKLWQPIQKAGLPSEALAQAGGGSRIRTHVPDLREAVFKTAALSHSAIPPVISKFINIYLTNTNALSNVTFH